MLTYDTIRDIKLCQHRYGYRFSIDALLLFSFVNLKHAKKVVDIGAGCGIIGILLAKKYCNAKVYLIEVQTALARLAEKNVELNFLGGRVKVLNVDIKFLFDPSFSSSLEGGSKSFSDLVGNFDLAVSNPPFRKPNSGRLSSGDEKAIARHEIKLNLNELINSASLLLKNHGRFCIIHLSERLPEIFDLMRQYRLEPKRLKFVHSKLTSVAKMVLIEGVKNANPDLKVEPPFYIYSDDGSYTHEAMSLFKV